jgi:hypothetical protein
MLEKCGNGRLSGQSYSDDLKEVKMFQQPFSANEAYGKHRSLDEMKEIERKNKVLEVRSYRYGDPVNSADGSDYGPPASKIHKEIYYQRRPRHFFFMVRLLAFLVSIFTTRSRA